MRRAQSGFRRPLFMFAAGLLLIIAALDIVWIHALAQPPKTNEDGVLTSRGMNERRVDFVWSSLFVVAGGGLIIAAFLNRHGPLVAVHEGGLEVAVDRPGRPPVFLPWEHITRIEAVTVDDDTGSSPALLIDLVSTDPIPETPWRAQWHGSRLLVDASTWTVEPVEIAEAAMSHLKPHDLPSEIPRPVEQEGAPRYYVEPPVDGIEKK